MSALAHFADLPDGTTVEFRDRTEVAYTDNQGRRHYRTIPARVSYQHRSPEDRGNVLYGYDPGRGWLKITRSVALKTNPSRHE